MRIEAIRSAVVGGWVLTLGLVAMTANLTSFGGWGPLVLVAVVPPVVVMLLRSRSDPSLSESIQKALGR
jgi:hypothetical protein